MPKTVILSPHLDDAVINCWQPIVSGDSIIINIFAGIPPEGTRRLWDRVCGEADSVKMMHERRRENDIAVSIGGSATAQVYLDYLDNQYREGDPEVGEMVESVLAKSPEESAFLAPLAGSRIYRHPDHVLARQI